MRRRGRGSGHKLKHQLVDRIPDIDRAVVVDVAGVVAGGGGAAVEEEAEPDAVVGDVPDGTLFVNSRPWSNITIDGKAMGRVGWKGDLSAGRHMIVLETADGRTVSQELAVRAGRDTRFCWDFDMEAECARR